MVLFGLRGLIRREQARQLLAWSVRRHWGFISLPELAQWQRGKPYFPHLPRCQFNLSHSGMLALCALSDRPVGVDIQMVRPVWRDSLIDRSCTPGERAWLRSRQDRPEEFAALWAAKECLGKQSGGGLPSPPSRLAGPLPPPGVPFAPGEVYLSQGRFLRFYFGDGWVGAACGLELPPQNIVWIDAKTLNENR